MWANGTVQMGKKVSMDMMAEELVITLWLQPKMFNNKGYYKQNMVYILNL